MARTADVMVTAVAPVVWGTTYLVTTEFLPPGYPITVAMLRALPAGILLWLLARERPERGWWGRIFLLGALNIGFFLICLFVAAYRLPGGVAATVGAVQPLFAILLARLFLGNPIRVGAIVAASAGVGGVALLVLTAKSALDPIGVGAGLAGALSMASGNVLARKWKSPGTSILAFTAWQLIAGGLLLVPVALWLEPPLPRLSVANVGGLVWLSVIGAALTYVIWFRGVLRMTPPAVSALLFLSPASAVLLGWLVLGQQLTALQILGVVVVLASIWTSQRVPRRTG